MRINFFDYLSEPQEKFFMSTVRFTAYGGARGGGKSWAVRKKATLLAVDRPGIKIIILRRTLAELRENHILPLQKDLAELAHYNATEKEFEFSNGSRILFGYCAADRDVLRYQGQEYDIIFIDEATHFSEHAFLVLCASLRGANSFPKRVYLTCNPGGKGHEWVKRLFVDKCYKGDENPNDYMFIPARVFDNLPLLKSDKGYVKMLENLPEKTKKAWLYGDWNVFEGRFFEEWREDLHVCEAFEVPKGWRRFFSLDYGLDMFAGIFTAEDPEGRAYVYREIYEPGLIVSQAARRVREFLPDGERIERFLAPPDLWGRNRDSGRSAAEVFWEEGIPLEKAPNSRIQGWMAVKERLHVGESGKSGLVVFKNCVNLIRTLPMLAYSDKVPGDVAGEPHELTHVPDALRYFCAAVRPEKYRAPSAEDCDTLESLLDYGKSRNRGGETCGIF